MARNNSSRLVGPSAVRTKKRKRFLLTAAIVIMLASIIYIAYAMSLTEEPAFQNVVLTTQTPEILEKIGGDPPESMPPEVIEEQKKPVYDWIERFELLWQKMNSNVEKASQKQNDVLFLTNYAPIIDFAHADLLQAFNYFQNESRQSDQTTSDEIVFEEGENHQILFSGTLESSEEVLEGIVDESLGSFSMKILKKQKTSHAVEIFNDGDAGFFIQVYALSGPNQGTLVLHLQKDGELICTRKETFEEQFTDRATLDWTTLSEGAQELFRFENESLAYGKESNY